MSNAFIADGTVAALVAILVQFLVKPLLEVWIKPDSPAHDSLMRAMAIVLGVVLTIIDAAGSAPAPVAGAAWLQLIGAGAIAGLTAVGAYHALTGSATPPNVLTSGSAMRTPAATHLLVQTANGSLAVPVAHIADGVRDVATAPTAPPHD